MQVILRVSGKALSEYYAVLKARRKQVAQYYRDNPSATLKECAKRFGMSYITVKRALEENGLGVDRYRNPAYARMKGARYWNCSTCGGRHRYVCPAKELPDADLQTTTPEPTLDEVDPQDLALVKDIFSQGAIGIRDPRWLALYARYDQQGKADVLRTAAVAATHAARNGA